MLSSMVGCGTKSESDQPAPAPTQKPNESQVTQAPSVPEEQSNNGDEIDLSEYTIGIAVHWMMDDWAKVFVETCGKNCEEYGINYVTSDANGDGEKQLNDLVSFRTMGVDAIALLPVNINAIADIGNEFYDENLWMIPNSDVSKVMNIPAYINGGQWDKGNAAGVKLVEDLGGEGKVIIFKTPTLATYIDERIQGFMDAIEGTNIEVIDTKLGATPEEFLNISSDIITSGVDVDAIWSVVGLGILGAGNAQKARGEEYYKVYGVDADYSIMQLIYQGWVHGATANYASDSADAVIDACVKFIKGEEVEYAIPLARTRDVVTKDNVFEICPELWSKEFNPE